MPFITATKLIYNLHTDKATLVPFSPYKHQLKIQKHSLGHPNQKQKHSKNNTFRGLFPNF
jgi:hypothetical protein